MANVGGIDRKLRVAVGIAIIAIGAFYESYWGAVGIIPLGTALIGWCPIYPILGISTSSKESGTTE